MQIEIVMRDMLFVNYAVPPERVRSLVPQGIELDTRIAGGRAVAFISAVAFTNAEVRSSVWSVPLPRASFQQINYRVYVNAGEGPAVYFLAMRVNSRTVAAASSLLRLPVDYQPIDISTAPTGNGVNAGRSGSSDDDSGPRALRYSLASDGADGLAAEVTIGDGQQVAGEEGESIPAEFFLERPFGYVGVPDGSVWKITVEHAKLDSMSARVESVKAPILESLKVLNDLEAARPHSALYVRETVFNTGQPALWTPHSESL